jgi:hypothetical protein
VQQTSDTGVLSARLYRGDDGVQYIIADENGTYDDGDGGYDLTVSVIVGGVAQSQTLRIISAKLPTTMNVICSAVPNKTGNNARKFYIDSNIATVGSIFAGRGGNDTWIMYENTQQVEFYPQFSETPGTNGYASAKSVSFSINRAASIAQEDLQGQEDLSSTRVAIESPYIFYNRSATNGGIVFVLE